LYEGNAGSRSLSYWDLYLAMNFVQLIYRVYQQAALAGGAVFLVDQAPSTESISLSGKAPYDFIPYLPV